MTGGRRTAALLALLTIAACSGPTDPAGEVANVRGTWQYSGDQAAPALTLEGTLLINTQDHDVIGGQLSWQEQGAAGGVRSDGGAVTGRVIEDTDIDFDVLMAAAERRHVGRITGDTIRGAWIEVSSGRSGNFIAVKAVP